MDYLKKHYEKIVIALLLAFLTYSVISQIVFTATVKVEKAEWKPGKDVVTYNAIDQSYDYSYKPAEDSKPFGDNRYLHCNNTECFHIMHDENSQCPWCRTPIFISKTGVDDPVTRDDDKDGIPNTIELQYDLDPKDPSDAKKDKDEDGFDNLTEYLNKTSLSNPKDFPALARLLRLRKVYNLYLDFVIDSVTVYDPNDKKKWEIQIKEKVEKVIRGRVVTTRKTSFKVVGDELAGGITIVDVNDDLDEGSTVTLKQGEEEFVVKANSKKILPPDSKRVRFDYLVDGEVQKFILKEGQEFILKGKNGVPQVYTLEELDMKKQTVLVVDDINGEFNFKVEKSKSGKKKFDLNGFIEGLTQ